MDGLYGTGSGSPNQKINRTIQDEKERCASLRIEGERLNCGSPRHGLMKGRDTLAVPATTPASLALVWNLPDPTFVV